MRALGMYIFGGSQTIGHLLEGWDIDTILEISNEMLEQNAYHFIRNYPNISVKAPSEYEKMTFKNYDLLFANPPCSGLSSINRNASAGSKMNVYLYKVIDMVSKVQPRVFFIENAPTLVSLGFSILQSMKRKLPEYKFLIINDCARNHNVAMHRRRTFVIGFLNKIPVIHQSAMPEITSIDALKNIDYTYNKEFCKDSDIELFKLYNYVQPGDSILRTLAEGDYNIPESLYTNVMTMRKKLQLGQNAWDKSSCRIKIDQKFPSFTSLTRLIHPIENRDLYIREYAHIMGYPDNFIFYPECKTHPVQCIAQGVPVNFIRYISREIMNSFTATEFYDGDIVYINQCNPDNIKINQYIESEFLGRNSL